MEGLSQNYRKACLIAEPGGLETSARLCPDTIIDDVAQVFEFVNLHCIKCQLLVFVGVIHRGDNIPAGVQDCIHLYLVQSEQVEKRFDYHFPPTILRLETPIQVDRYSNGARPKQLS